ncbi:metalloendopeptidase [Kluyveromyces lactis]|uniref:KLLA0A07711p n=1 Tax=Kluyveromyces lactis (strain ATCC 8585 / CBS 2359 / DSM 70799 / NBRC 1267 / NRRL Y-1140 / WM37) TaxID=284590 RepID=Q6CXJ6_KLULA|nr:uncharacterized protein KLLA0_A07711g [Kluyveromyces lactis]CAH02931.1 KLLA0A07711p [Kluyveromyces lactis]|eukprot:XP_451343.1 uncharacterized protein KLLA0_A07711g [Kluyveromyces lactis]
MFKNVFSRLLRPQARFYNTPIPRVTYKRFNGRTGNSFTQLLFDKTSRKYLAIVFGTGSLFYLTHLEEAPVTARTRFIWLPRSLELKIGQYTYNSVLSETKGKILPESHPLTRKVTKIFHRIVEAAEHDPSVDQSLLKDVQWKIHIVNDPRAPPNAFVLPGGKVFVFSNILPICQNEDGLATVLSHEFAHQLARHTAENLSKAPAYSILGALIYAVTGLDGINRLLVDGLVRMPASREMETEADYIGLMVMSRACFHPEESLKVWQRMAAMEEQQKRRGMVNVEFLSTHPATTRRIENMAKWLPKSQELYSQANCGNFGGFYNSFQDAFGYGNSVSPEPRITVWGI